MFPTPDRPWFGTFVEQQIKGLTLAGIEVRVLYIDRKSEGPLAYFRAGRLVEKAESEFSPDIVHVMYGGVMAERIVRRRRSRPAVVTYHGSDLLGENLSGALRKVISHLGVRSSRIAARKADGLVIVAAHLKKALPSSLPPDKVRVIPCGIDLDHFRPLEREECRRRLGWDSDRLHILFPANTGDPVKRPWLAQNAVDCYTASGQPAVMHKLSGIPYQDVPLWINASDLLILTSLHEGSPTVVKEALACNVPVVSVDVGDVAERLKGIAGCHLAFPEAEDLANKIRLVGEGSRRINGRDSLRELSLVAVGKRLATFYAEVLANRPPGSIPQSPN